MSMKMMNAAYLVDNAALLSLQEKQDGVEFHCFDMDSKVQTTEGHIGWDVLDKQPSSTLEESARVVALQKISQLDGLAVAPVAPEMLEQVRGGRKVLWQMKKADPELENAKNIRFITSNYEDRFKIPDGSAVEIEYPNRKFSARCEYMDEYHLRLGYDVLHICQLAEMLERGGGTCRPEPLITEERSAWDLGGKGFLAIQTCEDGYDYTLYHKDFTEIDGGQIDNPEISMNSLDFEVTPHLLRHTYITNLIHASVDPKTVQYLAGHENSKITMDIYAKAKYNRPDELAGILEDTFTLWDAE